jgi:hypothetical protein
MSNNPWIQHVKKYATENNVSYMCAVSLPECKAAYYNKSSTDSKVKYIYQLGNKALYKIVKETYSDYTVEKYPAITFKSQDETYILKFKDEPDDDKYVIKKSMFSDPQIRDYSMLFLKSFNFDKSIKVYHSKDGKIKMRYI